MFAFRALAGLLVLASPFVALADVTPSEPSPGSVFKAGSTCRLSWQGDTDSTTIWKGMAVELMSGSNLDMVHVTTVVVGQDGTKDGSYSYTCPQVTPYSDIYFYQFSSNHTTTKTWTTRFVIEAADGSSTTPANSKQPSGEDIPWGIGHLVDQSAAVPPPFATGSNTTTPGSSSSLSSTSPSSSQSNGGFIVATSSSLSSSSGPPSSTSSSKASTASSGALANAVRDRWTWMAVLGALTAVSLSKICTAF